MAWHSPPFQEVIPFKKNAGVATIYRYFPHWTIVFGLLGPILQPSPLENTAFNRKVLDKKLIIIPYFLFTSNIDSTHDSLPVYSTILGHVGVAQVTTYGTQILKKTVTFSPV